MGHNTCKSMGGGGAIMCGQTLYSRAPRMFFLVFVCCTLNHLTAGAAYIRVFIFYWHIK